MKVFESLTSARDSDERMGYIAEKEGMTFFQKFGGPGYPIHYDIVKKVTGPFELPAVEEQSQIYSYDPIPDAILARTLAVFKKVYDEHKAEMIVILEWDLTTKSYQLARPKCCTIGPAYLKYRQETANMGTIHSHAGFGASFSSTDDANEKNQPGIYMVMGHMGRTKTPHSIVASITGMGNRYTIDPPDLSKVELTYELTDEEYEWWMERVQLKADIQNKKSGWFILSWEGDIIWWTETEEEAKTFEEPGIKIVEFENLEKQKRQMKLDWSSMKAGEPEQTQTTIDRLDDKKENKTTRAWVSILVEGLSKTDSWADLCIEVFDHLMDHVDPSDWERIRDIFGDLYENLSSEISSKEADFGDRFSEPTEERFRGMEWRSDQF